MIRFPWRSGVVQEAKDAQAAAEAALAQSRADLARTHARGRDVRKVANRLRAIQHENHFAENIRAIYGGQS